MITARADVIGSLLRPRELLQAREARAAGRLSRVELEKIEDRAVDEAVALQEGLGLEVVTDGEMRRSSFQSQMTDAVSGFAEHGLDAFLWGKWRSNELEDWNVERPELAVVSKLERRRSLSGDELVYLSARAKATPKITLPSPTLFINFWSRERSRDVYPTLDAYLADVVALLREEVAELSRLGATYVQLDAPHYTSLLNATNREFYEGQGWTIEGWLDRGIELENAVMEGHPELTFGFHL